MYHPIGRSLVMPLVGVETDDMADLFKSAKDKFEQGKEHCATFFEHANAWMASNPYRAIVVPDPVAGDSIIKIVCDKSMPERLENVASDAINNLRGALDQAAYAVADRLTRNNRDTHFPFGDTLAEALNRKSGGSRAIPKDFFDLMLKFKPYRAGNTPLWALNKLRNRNEHRITCAVGAQARHVVIGTSIGGTHVGVGLGGSPPVWDPAKLEMEVLRVPAGDQVPSGWVDHVYLTFGEFVSNQPMDRVFNGMVKNVGAILARIESKFAGKPITGVI
jgi:hypothetical protein